MIVDLLAPHRAAFAGVRIEAGDSEARPGEAETGAKIAVDDPRRPDDEFALSAFGASASGMWMVIGTTASVSDQIIMTGNAGLAPGLGELAQDIPYGRGSGTRRHKARPWRSDW